MDIDYTVAALMFPAIPLMMTMYSNRFHTLSAVIRKIHDQYTFEKKDEDDLTPITSKNFSLEDLQKSWISKIENKTIFISALKKEFYEEFKTLLYGEVKKLHEKRYPYNNFLY